jgi:hypothetical protein
MRRFALPLLLAPALFAGCATPKTGGTLADLHHVDPDLKDATVDQGL